MRRHRVAKIVVALLIGVAPTAGLSVSRLGATAASGSEAAGDELPWPYCAPDAKAPAFSPLPVPPPDEYAIDRFIRVMPPLAEVLLPVEEIELNGDPMTSKGFEGMQVARARTGPPIFQSQSSVDLLGTLSGGPESIVSDATLLRMVADRLRVGDRVAMGVDARWDDGTLSSAFAIDLTTGEVMSYGAYADMDNAVLLDFVGSRFPDSSSGPALAELLVQWNREQDASTRPISDEWVAFLRDTYGIGLDLPKPGTEEWWQATPARCRSLADAPPSVTAGLDPVTVWVRVPSEMVEPRDAVICLHIELGSMGCMSFRPEPGGEYTELMAFSDGANPISVQVARETPEGVSWIERTEIARIPPSLAANAHAVLVTLNPDLSASTYDGIVSRVGTAESTVGALSVDQEWQILIQEAIT